MHASSEIISLPLCNLLCHPHTNLVLQSQFCKRRRGGRRKRSSLSVKVAQGCPGNSAHLFLRHRILTIAVFPLFKCQAPENSSASAAPGRSWRRIYHCTKRESYASFTKFACCMVSMIWRIALDYIFVFMTSTLMLAD